jgi:hypothetical protein
VDECDGACGRFVTFVRADGVGEVVWHPRSSRHAKTLVAIAVSGSGSSRSAKLRGAVPGREDGFGLGPIEAEVMGAVRAAYLTFVNSVAFLLNPNE